MHTLERMLANGGLHACTRTHTHTHTHTHTQAHTHTGTHTHRGTYTGTNTHIPECTLPAWLWPSLQG